MHLTATLPLYMYRSIGEGAHFSYIMGVHIICLIVFIPLLTGLIRDFDLFTILEIGCVVTSLSPVFLLLGSNYFTLGVFMAYCSIGESIYSPRLVDYTIAYASEGKEAVYLGLANVPNSISLFITGLSNGLLMPRFCPQDGEKNCGFVWMFIGLYCLVACFF